MKFAFMISYSKSPSCSLSPTLTACLSPLFSTLYFILLAQVEQVDHFTSIRAEINIYGRVIVSRLCIKIQGKQAEDG